jgi:acetyl esterase/lipase
MTEPEFMQPFVLMPPEVPVERIGNVDLYIPTIGRPVPAVVFVHGGPLPEDLRPTPRDWPVYIGYGRASAERRVAGAVVEHRLHSRGSHGVATADVRAALDAIRSDERIDGERIALWMFSGAGLLTAPWLQNPPAWLRCLAMSYAVLDSLPERPVEEAGFRPVQALAGVGSLPLVLVRAGLDAPEFLRASDEFADRARLLDANLTVIDVPNGHHGFDLADYTDQSRDAVRTALDLVVAALI